MRFICDLLCDAVCGVCHCVVGLFKLFVSVVFGNLNVCCVVLSVICGVRCCVVCAYLCVCV